MENRIFVTSRNGADNHEHMAVTDADGNGQTTTDGLRKHFHPIMEGQILPVNNHRHQLIEVDFDNRANA